MPILASLSVGVGGLRHQADAKRLIEPSERSIPLDNHVGHRRHRTEALDRVVVLIDDPGHSISRSSAPYRCSSWSVAEELPVLYAQRGLEWVDYPAMVELLRRRGITGVNPLLSEAENRELFVARSVAHRRADPAQ